MEAAHSTESPMSLSPTVVPASRGNADPTSLKDFWRAGGFGNRAQPRHTGRPEPLLLPGYITAFAILFATTFLVPYGFSDSYNVLADALKGSTYNYDLQLISYGRPVYGLLAHLAFFSTQSIDDFRYLRLAAVIGTGLLAWLFYHALRMAGFRQGYALTIPLLICTTPAYAFYIGWEDCAFFPYAAVLAGAALILLDRPVEKRFSKKGLFLWSASAALLTISMMIYQPAAMVFWAFAAIFLLGRQSSFKSAARRLGAYGIVIATSLGVDYAESKFLPELLYDTRYPGTRTNLVTDPFGKAIWFIRESMVNALNLWNVEPRIRIAVIVAVFTSVGLFLFLPGKLTERGGKFLIALALLPLSYLPSLVVQENFATYRTQVALTSLLALYAGFALLGWLSHIIQAKALQKPLRIRQIPPGKLQHALAASILIGGVIFGSLMAANNVTRYLVLPQAKELSFMAGQLNSAALARATSIYIILCTPADSISPVVRYDEFGRPSCSQYWVPGRMAYLLLREYHPTKIHLPIIVQRLGGPISPPPGSLVIDMRTLKNYRIVNTASWRAPFLTQALLEWGHSPTT